MKRLMIYIALCLVLATAACKKPFSAQLITSASGLLAIDGPIISGDSTFITLTRTTTLNDPNQQKAELKAIVAVEDDQGKTYPLAELGKGKYALGITNFDPVRKYRLDVKTSAGKLYQSDFVPMKVTPPIDTVYYGIDTKQVQYYVDAHDPNNATRYYRWDYKETWQYNPYYDAFYAYVNGQVISIAGPNQITASGYYCYFTDFSNQIFIGNSVNLAQDIIKKQPLATIPDTSRKLSEIYAIVVRQYALTQDGFNYFQNLKTNTENLGTLFDAQPSTTTGNIHCITTPAEPVYGFISASTVTSKIVIFKYADQGVFKITPGVNGIGLNNNSNFYYAGPDSLSCLPHVLLLAPTATFNNRAAKSLATGDSLLFNQFIAPPTGFEGYLYAPKKCVDCSTLGGTKTRPSYFPLPF